MKIIKSQVKEYRKEAKSIFDRCFPGQDFEFNLLNDKNVILLAYVDDRPVGMCMLNDTDLGAGVYPCVYNLCVLPEHRYRGIATALATATPACYIMTERPSKVTTSFHHMGYRSGYNVLSRGIKKVDIGGMPSTEHYDARQNIVYLN